MLRWQGHITDRRRVLRALKLQICVGLARS
jgi:hypothetical protein